jgi:hypothetical protein
VNRDGWSGYDVQRHAQICADKFLLLNAEYGCCLFDQAGDEVRVRWLPVNELVATRVDAWERSMDDWDKKLNLSDTEIDFRPFADEGYHAAVALKAALPDWTISYWDELLFYIDPAGNVCPEILADGSLGPCVVDWCLNKPAALHRRHHIFAQHQISN